MPEEKCEEFIDLDKALEEKRAKRRPLLFRYRGQDWKFPHMPPAAATVKVIRMQLAGKSDKDLTEAELFDIAAALIPKAILDEWLSFGIDTEELGELVLEVFLAYQKRRQGEVRAPEATGAPQNSSSEGGQSSRPTSSENTGSI